MVFPEPLSPTRPYALPRSTRSDTSRTTGASPNQTLSPSTTKSSLGTADTPNVVGNAISEQAEEETGNDDSEPWKDHKPRCVLDEVTPIGDHHAPFRSRGLNTEAEISESRA